MSRSKAEGDDDMIAEVQIRSAKMPSDVRESAVLIAQGVDL